MRNNPITHGIGEIQVMFITVRSCQRLQLIDKPQTVLFMPEFLLAKAGNDILEDLLPFMAERGMSQIVAGRNGDRQLRIEPQPLAEGDADCGNMVHVFNTCTNVVVLRGKEDLGLVFQPAVGGAMQDPVIVPPEFTTDITVPLVYFRLPCHKQIPFFVSFSRRNFGKWHRTYPLCIVFWVLYRFRIFPSFSRTIFRKTCSCTREGNARSLLLRILKLDNAIHVTAPFPRRNGGD